MSDDGVPGEPAGAKTTVAFDYIKGQFFRVIHADGAIGGPTPSGGIHMALFSERAAIPQRIVHEVGEDGRLGPLLPGQTLSRGSVVRELDVDIVMTLSVAQSVVNWLQTQINDVKAIRAANGENEES